MIFCNKFTFSIVVCNLYPFSATISNQNVTLAEAVENIDIGQFLLAKFLKNFRNCFSKTT